MPLIRPASIMILAGVLVSPLARIALLPAIGITSSGIAKYQTDMYSDISGSNSGSAPNSVNMGFSVTSPSVDAKPTSSTASSKPWQVKRAAFCAQPWPSNRPIHVDKPMPMPMVMQLMAKVTGKVKLTAARACVPSNEIKKVSTRLNIKIATIPNMVGMVMVRNVLSIGAVNSPCLSCM